MERRSGLQLILAAVIALGGAITYLSTRSVNPTTGEVQHVALTPAQEISLGLQESPGVAAQFGGEANDPALQAYVDSVGQRIIARSDASKSPYRYRFHLLADEKTLNAFALPGGQIFVTRGLLELLTNEAQLAGCLAHETGHVVARHSAEQMAKQQFSSALVGAAGVASYDPDSAGRSVRNAYLAQAVAAAVNLRYSRQDESEADAYGVRFMRSAAYDPRGMVQLLELLARSGGGRSVPEFFSSHPDPRHRIQDLVSLLREGDTGELGEAAFRAHVHPRGRARDVAPGGDVSGDGR